MIINKQTSSHMDKRIIELNKPVYQGWEAYWTKQTSSHMDGEDYWTKQTSLPMDERIFELNKPVN